MNVVERQLISRNQVIKELRETLKKPQARMKKVYDKNHRKRQFEEGE